MPRFTLTTALVSLTCFCVAAGMFRLAATLGEGDIRILFFAVSCISAGIGLNVLVPRTGFTLFLGILLQLLMVLGLMMFKF